MTSDMIKKIESILPWSFLGVLLSVLLGGPALYLTVHEKKPELIFQVIAESNILDIHTPMKELKITFRDDDIYETKQNLKFYILKIKNDGDKNVVQSDFDQNQIWGIEFTNSKIIETPQVIDSNSDYIKNNLKPQILSENTVELSKIIFEKGKFATVEVKILHNIEIEPEIIIKGKVAGVEKQFLELSPAQNQKHSIWEQLFTGSVIVQTLRVVIYFAGSILFLIALVFVFELPGFFSRKSSKKKLKKYLEPILAKANESEQDQILSFCKIFSGNPDEMEKVLFILENEKEKVEEILQKEKEARELDDEGIMPFRVYNVNVQNKIYSIDDEGKILINKRGQKLLNLATQFIKDTPPPANTRWYLR